MKPVLIVLALAVLLIAARQFDLGKYIDDMRAWGDTCSWCAIAAFVGLYTAATLLALPGSILTLAAGAIFGLAEGTLFAFLGALSGSVLAFLLARYVARGWIEARLSGDERMQAIDRAMGREGLKIMALMRLSPVFPFNFLNFALGLTRVSVRDYVLANFAMLPGTFLYVYYGYAAGSVAQLVDEGGAVERDWKYWTFLGVGLVATVAVTVLITKAARRALREEAEPVVEVVGAGTDTGGQDSEEGGSVGP
jgi:uncharacterized membrane protein YdjX (TVP38/TMEM64 family)